MTFEQLHQAGTGEGMTASTMMTGSEEITDILVQGDLRGLPQSKGHGGHSIPPRDA